MCRQLMKLALAFSLMVSLIQAAPLIEKQDLEDLATEVPDASFATISILEDLGTVQPTTRPPFIEPNFENAAVILEQKQYHGENGDYAFSFLTSNGIEVEETGNQKEIEGVDGEKTSGTASSGSYSYFITDGNKVKKMKVVWTADERGFRPLVTITDV